MDAVETDAVSLDINVHLSFECYRKRNIQVASIKESKVYRVPNAKFRFAERFLNGS